MVLKITVKTLDSQNYQFESQDDWTITQFKEHIQETVNVPANEQRLIFCGRVLQNDKKLTEYDCNDKVIHLVRRPPPSQEDERDSNRSRMSTDENRTSDLHNLEGQFTISATFETSTNSSRPTNTATIVLTSDPSQMGVNIPITIPVSQTMGWPFFHNPQPQPQQQANTAPGVNNESQRDQQDQQQSQSTTTSESDQSQSAANQEQSTTSTSNSTQTQASRQINVISGRIPIPFEYYLTILPPNQDQDPNAPPRPNARIQFRPSRRATGAATAAPMINATTSTTDNQASSANPEAGSTTNNAPNTNSQAWETGMAEIAGIILSSVLNRPNQPRIHTQMSDVVFSTPPPAAATTEASAQFREQLIRSSQVPPQLREQLLRSSQVHPQDSFMHMLPEFAINAASQILSGVFGVQAHTASAGSAPNTAPPQPPTAQPRPRQAPASSNQSMMDIDIDDSSSSQSANSRYQDARESAATPSTSTSASNSTHVTPQGQERSHPSSSRAGIDKNTMREVLRDHLEWLPIIEADLNFIETQGNRMMGFSDAYLSSIPRKRRRVLMASPDRVLILQPSPSDAVGNIIRRAVLNSNAPSRSLDQFLQSLANDQELLDAYEEYIKSAVEARLRSDEDFNPDKYEHTGKYFK